MAISLVVAVTDSDWFETLRTISPLEEVNFWSPSGSTFRALEPGELFLFKLHAPRNFIVGGGVFTHANVMPCSLAWDAFGIANGARSFSAMRSRIAKYRKVDPSQKADFDIGCRILSQPVFLNEADWIPIPESWSPNIVSFKTYGTDSHDGLSLWNAFESRVQGTAFHAEQNAQRFGTPRLVAPRLGQGGFRSVVRDVYQRKCAVTGERTLPALEAAHIKPYADGGEHSASNGILLRRDLHSLFDAGYVTVTPKFELEVSRRIREEFDNGRHYYALHGQRIQLPEPQAQRPNPAFLEWHNLERYKG